MTDSALSSSRLQLGAAWYPEHWPEERWPEDVRLMREAGMTVARLAEFAWSTLEPGEGQFDFDWLDRAVALLAEAGMVSVLGTPTAAPPAWLVHTRPETLAVNESGQRVQFGNRCHYCVNSPEFHVAVRRIVEAMATRFGDNPNVIGWQLDNEYNRVCYCDHCHGLFRQFLAERYGSLDELNERWTTRYWSQTYSAWDQIPIPVGRHNPGLRLEFKRFVTESYKQFQKLQLDVLRPLLRPGVWVTHNFMKWFGAFDHYALSNDLDMASWDWYTGTGHNDYLSSGADHDLVRGFKQANFWLMETQPGNVNWSSVNNSLNRGEARAMAWHAVAHGADAVLYWQWRSALNGQEQYHGTLLDAAGEPRLFYDEVKGLGHEFETASALLAGSEVKTKVAILNSYDSRWSIEFQPHHQDFDYVAHLKHYYRPLAAENIAADIISADAPLSGYSLVIAPALLLLSEERASRLRAFARRGKTLVLTPRCGMKDEYNALLPSRQPGPLAEIAGVDVEEYYALDEPAPVNGNWFTGVSQYWAERLRIPEGSSAQIAARYGECNGWLDGQPAITVSPYGGGLVYYVGTYLDEEAQQALISHMLPLAGGRPPMQDIPAGVEVRTRVTPDRVTIFIIINHLRQKQTLRLQWPATEHLTGEAVTEELVLEPYGVALVTKSQ